MITLRNMVAADITTIQHWPSYPAEFDELDYALRDNGWPVEFLHKPDTWIYVAELDTEIIAFSLLTKTAASEAEFRIALRADKLGQGLGGTIAAMTLTKGFSDYALDCIHLIVRKTNSRAIRLYHRLGFIERGECVKQIHGKPVRFLTMIISHESYS